LQQHRSDVMLEGMDMKNKNGANETQNSALTSVEYVAKIFAGTLSQQQKI